MIITGITPAQFTELVDKVSARYDGNLEALVGTQYSSRRFNGRVLVCDSGVARYGTRTKLCAPGARKSWNGRRIAAACWHAYRDVLVEIFALNPDARVYTAMAKYIGAKGFYDSYPQTAHRNIGSMAAPAYMPELCDCEHHGNDTREDG